MTYADYYRDAFRLDLQDVVRLRTDGHRNAPEDLQPMGLSSNNPAISRMSRRRQALFATALYFTVLVDQVMYTWFRPHYGAFRALTLYPKFKGNCPGGCHSHIHPEAIFLSVGAEPGVRNRRAVPGAAELLEEALPVMEREVEDYFHTHQPECPGSDVWRRCVAEPPIPVLFRRLLRESERTVD